MLIRSCSILLSACFFASPVFAAGPTGGAVSAGAATISQSAAQTTIRQSSDKAVINWGNFSIGSGASVRFVQPSASSIALNRVTGTQASVIQGALQANGQVWVLNPNGVLIAPTGQVAAGSFLATTRSLTDQQFMAGNYAFTDGGVPGASVVNQGSIIVAEGGYAVLAGEAVRNEGYIEANLGQVVLGGAKAFTLDLSGDNTLAFVVTAPVDVTPTDGKAIVDNSGSIQAAGGRVLMTARAASQVVGQVINTDGIVAATSARMVNGKIVLDGGTGSVSVAGNLNASGKGDGQTGGAIDVNAQKIQVKPTAKLDVSGDAGGGKIAIGGGGPNTRTQSFTPAVSTTIASGASLDVSALTRGDGGEIIVFTSLANPLAFTQVAGSLIARGGAQGGNGGFIETSGYRLDVNGIFVSTLAPKGRVGLWLLDPADIEIISGASLPGSCVITANDCSSVQASALGTILSSGTNVALSATNSITVSTGISWSGNASLTLSATNAVTVNGTNISWTGSGDLTLSTTSPTGSIQINNPIYGYGTGNLSVTANTINVSALITVGGSFSALSGGSNFGIVSGGGITANGVSINAQNVSINGGIVGGSGGITIEGATVVDINATPSGSFISVTAPGGSINVATGIESASATLSAATVTFSAAGSVGVSGVPGGMNVTATSAINVDVPSFSYSATPTVFNAPVVNWIGTWSSQDIELKANTVNWGTSGAYSGGNGSIFTVGVPYSFGTTTFNLVGNLNLEAYRFNINNPLAWSTYQLQLNANQTGAATPGVALNAALTGTNGAKLAILPSFFETGGPQTISLTGTFANQSTFTLGAGQPQTTGTVDYSVAPNIKTVVVDNSGGGGGGGGGGGRGGGDAGGSGSGSGSSETPVVVVTPAAVTTSSTAAATAAAAAAANADAAAARAATEVVIAQAAAQETAAKVVVVQALTQAVATVVASTSATVFVAPPPAPPVIAPTFASTTTSLSATPASSPAATTAAASTTTTTTATTTTATTTTATTTTATTAAATPTLATATPATTTTAAGTAQTTAATPEVAAALSVTTPSSTTAAVSDPGDTSAATTSTGPRAAPQAAAPASSVAAAPSAPALTPVAVRKDGADAGDFTLQTVKPPAPVTTAKQEARPAGRVTTTPVSSGIALQATQKNPAPSGSVMGREISGSGNSANW